MHSLLGFALVCACLFVFAILVIALWKSALAEDFHWSKEPSEELRLAEKYILEVSRSVLNLVTVPLLGLLQRSMALDEERVADVALELKGLPSFVNVFLGDYLDAFHQVPPLERLAALEDELAILEKHLQLLYADDGRFCAVRMLLEIDACREKLGMQYWKTDYELLGRANRIRETFIQLEGEIYELAALIKERETYLRHGGSDDDALHDGDI